MRWNPHSSHRILIGAGLLFEAATAWPSPVDSAAAPVEMSFIKGDTHQGSKVRIRIAGDSLYFHETRYTPDQAPAESDAAVILSAKRRRALKGAMGSLPRYPVFGSCFGKGMRYYLVETAEGKFYRSVPEQSGKCYVDEPGIWSLFQDLDDLTAPPSREEQEYSAS